MATANNMRFNYNIGSPINAYGGIYKALEDVNHTASGISDKTLAKKEADMKMAILMDQNDRAKEKLLMEKEAIGKEDLSKLATNKAIQAILNPNTKLKDNTILNDPNVDQSKVQEAIMNRDTRELNKLKLNTTKATMSQSGYTSPFEKRTKTDPITTDKLTAEGKNTMSIADKYNQDMIDYQNKVDAIRNESKILNQATKDIMGPEIGATSQVPKHILNMDAVDSTTSIGSGLLGNYTDKPMQNINLGPILAPNEKPKEVPSQTSIDKRIASIPKPQVPKELRLPDKGGIYDDTKLFETKQGKNIYSAEGINTQIQEKLLANKKAFNKGEITQAERVYRDAYVKEEGNKLLTGLAGIDEKAADLKLFETKEDIKLKNKLSEAKVKSANNMLLERFKAKGKANITSSQAIKDVKDYFSILDIEPSTEDLNKAIEQYKANNGKININF